MGGATFYFLQYHPINFMSFYIFKIADISNNIKLDIIQLLMNCPIQFHPNKISNCHGNGVIELVNYNAYFVSIFLLHKLPITTAKIADITRFGIDLKCKLSPIAAVHLFYAK